MDFPTDPFLYGTSGMQKSEHIILAIRMVLHL